MNLIPRILLTFSLALAAACGAAEAPTETTSESTLRARPQLMDGQVFPAFCCDSPDAALGCGFTLQSYLTRCQPMPEPPAGGGGGEGGGEEPTPGEPLQCTGTQIVVNSQTGEVSSCQLQEVVRDGEPTCACVLD